MSQAGPAQARPTSIAELRAVTQPPEVRGRRNAEHWTASLYLRRFSPYLTWFLLKTPISANGVTGLMILVGWSTADLGRLGDGAELGDARGPGLGRTGL